MNFRRLLSRNLRFHWRGNLAVLLGIVVGTAVLIGALLVGDSLRGSLRDLTLQRLGWVDDALVASRFVRAALVDDLPAERKCGAILLQGAAHAGKGGLVRRAGKVTVLGVDNRFWPTDLSPDLVEFWNSSEPATVLNEPLARALGVGPGETIALNVQRVSAIPRESLLGRRDTNSVLDELRLTVSAVLPDDGPGRFSLAPNVAAPLNAFVPLRLLQDKLGQSGRVNTLLAAGSSGTAALQDALRQHLVLEDWGLTVHVPKKRAAYLSLESRQLLIEPVIADAALAAARDTGLRSAPTLVYLANSIGDGKRTVPYSLVAALDPSLPPPLGPFLPPGVDHLTDEEIVLVDWKESPLQLKPGDPVLVSYFDPDVRHEEGGQLKQDTATFRLRGFVSLRGVADDPDLTPEFPGITDKLDIRDWDPPFPYDNTRVKKRDDDYWKKFRTTPKGYVTLAAGQKLWRSRFGELTSIRLAPETSGAARPADLSQAAGEFRRRLLERLTPDQGGLTFDAVRSRGLEASGGGTDFGGLFLGFSFFLIIAALLMVGLLVRLNLDRRAAEVGLLLATGYRRRTVRRLLIAEGTVLALSGGALGAAGAVLYAWLLLELLASWWPGGLLDRSFLRLHVTWLSFLMGYAGSFVVSVLTISWAVRGLGRVAPNALLHGETTATVETFESGRRRWSWWVAWVSLASGVILLALGGRIHDHEAQAVSFFGGGALLLTAGLAGVWAWLRRSRQGSLTGHGKPALARLGIRNAARHPIRSLLTAGLLASAAFLVVAVESFRRNPERDFLEKDSGSGGFPLLAESDVPIFQDLNGTRGRDELAAALEIRLRDQEGDVQQQLARAQALLDRTTFYPFRVRAGDDASCLNLYQPGRPRLYGVPHSLIERGGFQFQATEAKTAEERANPWVLLDKTPSGGAVPVFGEKNTVEWQLKSGLGRELEVLDVRGMPVRLRIVGLLQDSVFQSELLMSETNFLRLDPQQQGYRFFLIDAPPGESSNVQALLDTALADRGFDATPSADRLAQYLAVENTYLSTFQALGGLGLVLGALGLAVVLLRSVWERRGELALLRALGFRSEALRWLLLAENGFLLAAGMAVGSTAALLSVAPQVLAGAGSVPWLKLIGMMLAVLSVGCAAGAAAVSATLRAELLPELRRE